jgi:hypothetical protein
MLLFQAHLLPPPLLFRNSLPILERWSSWLVLQRPGNFTPAYSTLHPSKFKYF